MNVAKTTMLIGALLCVLGFVAYAAGGQTGSAVRSPTALIPAGFGAILLLLGFGALARPGARKHFMHAAAAVGLLGALGGLGMFFARVGNPDASALAKGSMLTMGILCVVLVALCVRSFVAARRARESGTGTP